MKFLTILPLIVFILSFSPISAGNIITNEILSGINTKGDETSLTISPSGDTIIFARKSAGENRFNLFSMTYADGSWSDPAPMEGINSGSDDISPFLADNGSKLVFASNRQGSLKYAQADSPSYDIYYSIKEDGVWTSPAQIFGAVNTREDEINPYITEDGNKIFFTRINVNDPEAIRIIEVVQEDDFWGDVKTAAISRQSEIKPYLIRPSLSKEGIYISAYTDTPAIRDIYFSSINEDGVREIVKAGEGINSSEDEIFVSEIGPDRLLISSNRGGKSNYNFYIAEAERNLSGNDSERFKPDNFIASPVYFAFNSSAVRLEDIPVLHDLIRFLRENRNIKVTINGYADGVGSYKANLDISVRRAEAVKAYLVNMGISSRRIITTGHGYRKTDSNETAQHHRRAEFKFGK
jgi:outer membrane protein OmpA-like peptidoglycan-associated protein